MATLPPSRALNAKASLFKALKAEDFKRRAPRDAGLALGFSLRFSRGGLLSGVLAGSRRQSNQGSK